MNPSETRNDAIRVDTGNPTASPHAAGRMARMAAADKATTVVPSAQPLPVTPTGTSRTKKAILAGLGLAVLAAIGFFGVPMLLLALHTVSTDDAYVNGHVTFVAARVPGQVAKVLVDDNNRVKKGDLLLQLDKEPYQVQVNRKEAVLTSAKADLENTWAQVHGQVAQARSSRFKLQHAIENVNNQIAQLRANVAALDSDLAKRDRALKDYERAKNLAATPGVLSQQDFDLKLQDYLVAKAKVRQSLEGVLQLRAGFGLVSQPINADEIKAAPRDLAEVPADLDQTFSTVREATSQMLQAAAALGVYPSSYDLLPKQILAEFLKRDPEGNIDRIYEAIIQKAPALEQAKARVVQANRDLDQAKLDLRYCDVVAEIDGQVTRRNINPGNNVQAGQNLMAIRSLTEIWIDANFKETQLAELRIGQPVKVEVDMYGSHKEFKGRITGFTMGTGQTLALLPPQNATGNFVKIVQRLPVKIELSDYDPAKAPLFIGLSATPYVYIYAPLTGDDPGRGTSLQPYLTARGKP